MDDLTMEERIRQLERRVFHLTGMVALCMAALDDSTLVGEDLQSLIHVSREVDLPGARARFVEQGGED